MPYIGNQPGTGVRSRFIYTATASQTTFSGADDNSKTLKYADSDYIDVYLNGVCLVPGTDYTASTKTSVVLTQAASLSDTLEVVAYDIASMADTVSKADGGTFEDGITIRTADNSTQLTLESTDTDASVGPVLDLYRNSASPADNDALGFINFYGENDADEKTLYGQIRASIKDASDGTEDARFIIQTAVGGTQETSRLEMTGTETVINEDSKDIDFRVESDNLTHALFVNGADGNVMIGTDTEGRHEEGADRLTIADAGHSGLTIRSGDSHYGTILFSDATSGAAEYQGSVFYYHASNKLVFANAGIDVITIDSSARTLIGTQTSTGNGGTFQAKRTDAGATGYFETNGGSTQNILDIVQAGSSGASQAVRFHNNGYGNIVGSIGFSTTATSYYTSSDYRLKENVTTSWDATTRLKQLKPSRFNFTTDKDKTVDGFLAHEVSSIVPEAVTGEKDATEELKNVILNADGTLLADNVSEDQWKKGKEEETYAKDTTWVASKNVPSYQSIDQSKLVPLLVKTIQELEARIATLEAQNTTQATQIADLITRVTALEAE